MDTNLHSLTRPETLEPGVEYIWREKARDGAAPAGSGVRFLGYTACPAVVIVADRSGKVVRLPRDEIFCMTVG